MDRLVEEALVATATAAAKARLAANLLEAWFLLTGIWPEAISDLRRATDILERVLPSTVAVAKDAQAQAKPER